MILAYCITPQPQRGGPTAKQFHVRTDGAIFSKVVAKKYNPAPLSIEMGCCRKLVLMVANFGEDFCVAAKTSSLSFLV
jgi:hypothetical protein